VEIKKKYKCYLYVDEAHSIGALGPNAKGVCDYYGVDPKEIEILMGTFTKSFGSVGGYISGNRDLITYLRQSAYSPIYATSMPAACVQQIISALRVITGEDGTDQGKKRIQSLRENSNYFRKRLTEMGLRIIGDMNSPVVPLMLYHPLKMAEFSRESLRRGIAVVVLGPPVTTWHGTRARFCLSAAHTKEQLDKALVSIRELGDLLLLTFENKNTKENMEKLLKQHGRFAEELEEKKEPGKRAEDKKAGNGRNETEKREGLVKRL